MKQKEQNRTSLYNMEDAYSRAQKKLNDLKGFYWHAFCYIVVNIFIFIITGKGLNWNIWHFGVLATPLFWGVGLSFHALNVFGKNLIFGKLWEERKIKNYMEKEQQYYQEYK